MEEEDDELIPVLVHVTIEHEDPDWLGIPMVDSLTFIDFAPEFPVSMQVYESYEGAVFRVKHDPLPKPIPEPTHFGISHYWVQ